MIDDLRAYLDSHRKNISLLGEHGTYTISTFHHGYGPISKVLFLICADSEPKIIAKIMRSVADNAAIEREYSALMDVIGGPFILPTPHGMTMIQGFAVSFEEVVRGRVLHWENASVGIPHVAEFVSVIPQVGTINIDDILLSLTLNAETERRIQELAALVPMLEVGKSHGDLTFRNILQNGDTLALIDWSEYGLRPLRRIDLAHYLLRLAPKKQEISFVRKEAERLGLQANELEILAHIDIALDMLKKSDGVAYETACAMLSSHIRS